MQRTETVLRWLGAIGVTLAPLAIFVIPNLMYSGTYQSGEEQFRAIAEESAGGYTGQFMQIGGAVFFSAAVLGIGCFTIAQGRGRTLGLVGLVMGTVSAIALGSSRSLIERAADVVLKERRKLIIVPRETPLSLIHLRNLTAITEAGGVVIPAAPGFYHKPTKIEELVDFIVQRVVDQVGLDISVAKRWEG